MSRHGAKTNAIEKRLTLARELADKAREISLPGFGQLVGRNCNYANKNSKGVFDPVTKTDKEVERVLRHEIAKVFPADAISGEEYGNSEGDSGWSWCIDPIDGTRAFIAGVPVWSTLIAVNYQGEPIVGLMDFPALAERYIGAPDRAWREDNSGKSLLTTKSCSRLDNAILSCTEPMAMFSPGQMSAYEMIRRTARFTRLGLDAYGFALIASGHMDIIIEAGLEPYDIAAHIPIIRAAGGVITGWHGENVKNGGNILCVGDKALLEQIYPYLQRAMD